jgi:hypothetical protein
MQRKRGGKEGEKEKERKPLVLWAPSASRITRTIAYWTSLSFK